MAQKKRTLTLRSTRQIYLKPCSRNWCQNIRKSFFFLTAGMIYIANHWREAWTAFFLSKCQTKYSENEEILDLDFTKTTRQAFNKIFDIFLNINLDILGKLFKTPALIVDTCEGTDAPMTSQDSGKKLKSSRKLALSFTPAVVNA